MCFRFASCTFIVVLQFGCATHDAAQVEPVTAIVHTPQSIIRSTPVAAAKTGSSSGQPYASAQSSARQRPRIDLYEYARSSLPDYARRAIRPVDPVAFLALPPDYYAVQLFALSSVARLEAYVDRTLLTNVSAARIEHNGNILFVLLLGIYPTRADAVAAVEQLPAAAKVADAWVRPLRGLQAAVQRADNLTGVAER